VDDYIIITDQKQVNEVKGLLSQRFKMKDLGAARSILSMEIIRDRERGTLQLRQTGHIKGALKAFGMLNCKPRDSPMPAGLQLSKPESTSPGDEKLPFRSLVGKLLYIAISTRPDITYAVCYLARFVAAYSQQHYQAALRILQYLSGTVDLSIQYCCSEARFIDGKLAAPTGYVDADWAGDSHDRKSTTGYIFLMCGGPVSWISKKQLSVTLSSCEAEYTALSEAVKQAMYLSYFRQDFDLDTSESKKRNADNQSAIIIATTPSYIYHGRTKHIDVRLHHIRGQVACGAITVEYCPTESMLADPLTKSLPAPHFRKLCALINMVSHGKTQ